MQGAFGTLLAMLDAGTADVAMELEPTVSIAVKQGARVVYSYPDMYGPFLLTGLYTTEDYRDRHREICQKVVNALERAVRYAHSDVPGTLEVAQKVFPELDADVVKNAVERMLREKTIPEDVTIDPRAWDNAIQVRIQVGDLKSRDVARETVDRTFAKEAVGTVGAEQKSSQGESRGGTMIAQPIQTGRMAFQEVLQALGNRRFVRCSVDRSDDLEATLRTTFARCEPIQVVLLWGKGKKRQPDQAERYATRFLTRYAERVQRVWWPGVRYSVLFADTHAKLNGYDDAESMLYFQRARYDSGFGRRGFRFPLRSLAG